MQPDGRLAFVTPQHVQRLCDALDMSYREIAARLRVAPRTLRRWRDGSRQARYTDIYALEQIEKRDGKNHEVYKTRPKRKKRL